MKTYSYTIRFPSGTLHGGVAHARTKADAVDYVRATHPEAQILRIDARSWFPASISWLLRGFRSLPIIRRHQLASGLIEGKKLLSSLPIWAIYVLSIIIGFVALNMVVIGGQKLWHRNDRQRLDTFKREIEAERFQIRESENALALSFSQLELLKKQIASRAIDIAAIESRYSGRIPEPEFTNYRRIINENNGRVTEHNQLLFSYRENHARYSSELAAANEKIDEANALAKKIGGIWYVIPIPGVRRAGHEMHLSSPK